MNVADRTWPTKLYGVMLYSTSIAQVKKKMHDGYEFILASFSGGVVCPSSSTVIRDEMSDETCGNTRCYSINCFILLKNSMLIGVLF